MTSQEVRIVDTFAEPASGIGPAEQVRASTAEPRTISMTVPTLLAFVAGYVDSCTFLAFNGLFVAQVTGSFVVAGSELVADNDGFLIKVLAIPVFFAAGVVTTVIVTAFGARDRRALVTTLALEAVLLAGLAWVGASAGSTTARSMAALFALSAMGIQSALSRLLLREYGSTNVMTGNTTQLSIDLTETVLAFNRDRRDTRDQATPDGSAPSRTRLAGIARIMLGFVGGTAVGGFAYTSLGLNCVALAVIVVAALAIRAARSQSQAR
jgi:uncharacterized membrane protein YoaK (UPF0700 family)